MLGENLPFRRFWLGRTISLFGDQISLIAIPLAAVLVLHANARQMGYLIAAELAPNLFFALHAGAWVDRRGRRRQMMIACDLGRGALIATIPLAYAFDALTIQQLYVVAFLVGTLALLFQVSHASLFVSIVPRERYVEANSLLAGSRAFSFVAGPSVGGILVQLLKAPFALVVDAVSFVFSALFLGSIFPQEPPTEEAERGHVVAGARFVMRTPAIRSALLATATINLFNFIFWALFGSLTIATSPVAAEYLAGESGILIIIGYGIAAVWLLRGADGGPDDHAEEGDRGLPVRGLPVRIRQDQRAVGLYARDRVPPGAA